MDQTKKPVKRVVHLGALTIAEFAAAMTDPNNQEVGVSYGCDFAESDRELWEKFVKEHPRPEE